MYPHREKGEKHVVGINTKPNFIESLEHLQTIRGAIFFTQELGNFHNVVHKKEHSLIVQRGRQQYVYKSIREGGKIRKVYLGKISSPKAKEFLEESTRKEVERETRKKISTEQDSLIEDVEQIRHLNNILIRIGLLLNDHFIRKSEIRRMKRSA